MTSKKERSWREIWFVIKVVVKSVLRRVGGAEMVDRWLHNCSRSAVFLLPCEDTWSPFFIFFFLLWITADGEKFIWVHHIRNSMVMAMGVCWMVCMTFWGNCSVNTSWISSCLVSRFLPESYYQKWHTVASDFCIYLKYIFKLSYQQWHANINSTAKCKQIFHMPNWDFGNGIKFCSQRANACLSHSQAHCLLLVGFVNFNIFNFDGS